jgi:hypothetical protein
MTKRKAREWQAQSEPVFGQCFEADVLGEDDAA